MKITYEFDCPEGTEVSPFEALAEHMAKMAFAIKTHVNEPERFKWVVQEGACSRTENASSFTLVSIKP